MSVRALLSLLLLPVLLAVPAGCGTAPDPSPPTGVDQLVVPTPSPDPADFVTGVDNPWFPLAPGTRWRYDVADVDGTHVMRVRVQDGPTVAGVATTARVTREPGRVAVDWYAQDTGGNVWWLGRRGSWRAGSGGAEAGLAMPAHPRIGDGYRTALAPGTVEDTAHVVDLGESATVPAGTFDGLLLVEERSSLEAGAARELRYAEGLGLLSETIVSGSYRTVRLADVTG